MESILSHVEQGVMTITLNRPERLNSFNDVMHQQLSECLKQAERVDAIRCLLITGAGRGFCAGQDLNDRNVDPNGPAPDLGMSVETFYNPLVRRLAKLPKPVICAVNGVAAGAGATLALGCDMVIAARSASFVMAFSKLGLVPDCGGTWLLPRVTGRARAMGLALLGDKPARGAAHRPLPRRRAGTGLGNDLAGGGRRPALRHRTADGAAFCLAADLWPGLDQAGDQRRRNQYPRRPA